MTKSLEEVHHSVATTQSGHWWRKLLAFTGPGLMISVGYMDPGNWATDLAGGSQFGYTLLAVVLASNLMAMVLQYLSLKLGIVAGKDLAQACRDHFGQKTRYALWIGAEIAITACDLAEVIGSAIALNLLFGLPIVLGVIVTSLDVLGLLLIQKRGQRALEMLVCGLVSIVLGSFMIELFWAQPKWLEVAMGFIPQPEIVSNPQMLYLAIGILGATVMPHNLYLHSALVQSRKIGKSLAAKTEAIKYAAIDSTASLAIASVVNASILILAAAVFYTNGAHEVAELQDAYRLLEPLLGQLWAPILFALALLASGQSSTITGTLAGQVVMEGFTTFKLKPWKRRLLTRALAIAPAVVIVAYWGEHGLANLLVLSQVILSLQLPFAVIPLVLFTADRKIMGKLANSKPLVWVSGIIATLITSLNVILLWQVITKL